MADSETRSEIRQYLTGEILNDPGYPLDDDESLISSGLIDSFSLVDIALWIEQTYGVHVDDTELSADTFDTVAELAQFIEARRAG